MRTKPEPDGSQVIDRVVTKPQPPDNQEKTKCQPERSQMRTTNKNIKNNKNVKK